MSKQKKPPEKRDASPFLLRMTPTEREFVIETAYQLRTTPHAWLYNKIQKVLIDEGILEETAHTGTQ